MNKFLLSASERYPEVLDKSLITPISKIDASIIFEVIEILKKTGLNEICSLLDQWKYLKDKEVYDKLQDWNSKHPIIDEEKRSDEVLEKKSKEVSLFKRYFICFQNYRLDIWSINSYESEDEYNFVKGEMEYRIVINRIPDTTSVINSISHKVIRYSDMELRDRDFKILDDLMESFKGVVFINKK